MKKRKNRSTASKSPQKVDESTNATVTEGAPIDGDQQPEQSPGRFLLLLWGLPFLVIVAAVALRMATGE